MPLRLRGRDAHSGGGAPLVNSYPPIVVAIFRR
jgi:hypothetical protein